MSLLLNEPAGVLANDSRLGVDPVTVSLYPDPGMDPYMTELGGTVVVNNDGTFTYTPPADTGITGTDTFQYRVENAVGISLPATVSIDITEYVAPSTQVTGRHIFYNASSYDGASPGNAGANAADDGAIDPSKQALLPLQSTTFVNWTGYDKGINGVMVDVLGSTVDLTSLTQEELAAYFSFDTSRTGSGFVGAPDPDIIAVRAGAGVDGGDRVTFIWDTTAGPVIKNTWLRVTVDASLGLGADDVFYFGNQIGDGDGVNGSGNPATTVNSVDQLGSRENPKGGFNPAPVGFQWDYNKDKNVNGTDQLIARENNTGLQHLGIFTAPMAGSLSAGNLSGGGDGGELLVSAALSSGDSGWSELSSGALSSGTSSGSSAAADERIWADEQDDLVGSSVSDSEVDAALSDDGDWLDSGWDTL